MERKRFGRFLASAGMLAGLWIAVRYFLPLFLPFLLGGGIALAAEPGVRFLGEKCRIPRAVACAGVISLGFVLLLAVVWIGGALVYRELTVLAKGLPSVLQGVSDGVERMQLWASELATRAPEGLRGPLVQWVGNLFAGGSVVLEGAAAGLLGMAGNLMGGIPGGAMLLGTAVISSFMISAQLPSLKERLRSLLSRKRLQSLLAAFSRVRRGMGGWLRAQLKLSGVTFGIVAVGFFLLRISNPLFWAVIAALVDAVPLLGTGTVLIPMALLALLRGDGIRAVGLTGLYVTAMLVRSALEPRLLGRQLGINPLMTLMALYAGYRLWGIGGMILAPILTVTAKQLAQAGES